MGRGWLNTGGADLGLAELRGRFVVLDFWTSGCINCLHVLDEMRPLEEKYADALVVVSVHSPKFAHEASPHALAAAVQRNGVTHPVLDDPELTTWQSYAVRAWPTLVVVDPEGYVVAQYAGEGHVHAIDALLGALVPEYEERGSLTRGRSPYVAPDPEPGDLRFPATAIRLPSGNILVADAGSGSVVELEGDAATVVGRHEGFHEPNGLVLLPEGVRDTVAYDVVVADTVAHRLVGLRLDDGTTQLLAGDGRQWMQGDGTTSLSSPWDVTWWRGRVWIAMAGIHQLWTYDPATGTVEVVAGTTNEGLVDGPLTAAWFAQPSRLAPDGGVLWLADPEASALRRVVERDGEIVVGTVVGQGLFDFGHVDGPAAGALFQHVGECAGAKRLGDLDGHVPEAAHADNGDLRSRAGVPVLERGVRRDTGAQQRRGDLERAAAADPRIGAAEAIAKVPKDVLAESIAVFDMPSAFKIPICRVRSVTVVYIASSMTSMLIAAATPTTTLMKMFRAGTPEA